MGLITPDTDIVDRLPVRKRLWRGLMQTLWYKSDRYGGPRGYICTGCGKRFILNKVEPHWADKNKTLPCCSRGCQEIVCDTFGEAQ